MRYRSKPVEVEAMQWNGEAKSIYVQPGPNSAQDIVAWVNANGGEARYEPPDYGDDCQTYPACIAVRTINGWAYAAPGHYVVQGEATFSPDSISVLRDFYPCDPETFERRWEPLAEVSS